MTVSDDGKGFDAYAMSATLEIDSAPCVGTNLKLTILFKVTQTSAALAGIQLKETPNAIGLTGEQAAAA